MFSYGTKAPDCRGLLFARSIEVRLSSLKAEGYR